MKKILTKLIKKVKKKIREQEREIVTSLVILMVALVSFQLGKMTEINLNNNLAAVPEISWQPFSALLSSSAAAVPAKTFNSASENLEKPSSAKSIDWSVVTSKNSNKYHFLWCPGAKQIAEKNKIIFTSEKEAQAAGYILAGNCRK